MPHPRRRALALLLPAVFFLTPSAQARPPYKRALADFLGPALAPRLNDCRTCHLPDAPDAAEGHKPHNPFGARLKAVRAELRKAGKPSDIVARLRAVAEEDSDGDGVPNLLELVTGHSPGDAADRPSAAEVVSGRKKLAAFLKDGGGYAWTPFERVRRPAVPAVQNAAWVRNPVDAFVAAEHQSRGLTPRPEAPREVLLRRVTLDLTGLPPTPQELHAFLADQSPDAYEKVVDRLLASPHYGERWGRHWMDVWRYSDWAGWGAQVRDSQPHVWHWRDWIVESLNADKGYDRMVQEMLAADELAPGDPDALRATGYLARNYKLLSREKWMQDVVDHTSQAFLGVTLGCARCHDHMFDPVTQKEYYQVRAVFEPHRVRLDRLPGQPDTNKDGLARAYDADLQVLTYLFVRGDDRTPDRSKPMPAGVPEVLGGHFGPVAPVPLPRDSYDPNRRAFAVKEDLAAAADAAGKAREALAGARLRVARAAGGLTGCNLLPVALRAAASRTPFDALELAEADAALAEARHAALEAVVRAEQLEDSGSKETPAWKEAATGALRAQRHAALAGACRNLLAARRDERAAAPAARPEAAKKTAAAVQALAKAEADAKLPDNTAYARRPLPTYPAASSGRRLAFARWIASRDNPLAARVAVNHIWLRHFGRGIVPSVFDFGRNGRPPSHPALLDWLAAEFMDRGWRMKPLHRLLVTSSTYRTASTPDAADAALDRDNVYLWRTTPRRVEAEVVRDCVFYVSGRLDLTPGGPDIDQNLGLTVPRRSLYFRHAAEKQMEFLKLFDAPGVTECYQRKESILPQQALALVNSELTLRHARVLARELAAKGADPDAFTAAAYERVLSRPPTGAERAECVRFLEEQARRHAAAPTAPAPPDADGKAPAADPAQRARENLVHVLMNHHDFVTIR
jgi:hypothetical protein